MAMLQYVRGIGFFADHPVKVNDVELTGLETTVGRSCAAHVLVPRHMVARTHARFAQVDGAWWVEDLRTPNGTYVNGVRIAGRVPLRDGDEVQLPGFLFVFRDGPSLKS